MAAEVTPVHTHLAAAMARERPRLVRLCAAITGDAHAAEDLAQETLLQAWAQAGKMRDLSDPAGISRWLDAFARNVCLRWKRASGRLQAHRASLDVLDVLAGDSTDHTQACLEPPDQCDPAEAVERAELERLLERALSTLPVTARAVVTRYYLREMPHAEIAAELRVSEAVVAQRLHRGRLALRKALAGALRADASDLAVALPSDDAPLQTRIWCPFCGARRLVMHRSPANGLYGFVCPQCVGGAETALTGPCIAPPGPNAGLTSPKAILSRQLLRFSDYYHGGLAQREILCEDCGGSAAIAPHLPDDLPEETRALLPSRHGTTITCPRCGIVDTTPLSHLALDLPEAVRFWRAHPRIRRLPEREVESVGQRAIISTYASMTDGARLEVLTARDTLQVLAIYGR